MLNLLAETIYLWGETYNIYLDWIGKIIRWLIESIGSVGLGIIVFSVLLKVIVMPFDVYQRITMRKQNVKMKENQEKMAKLQKQYANNKELYNQKYMEMMKESGFSMFSSCLPMILSMVIFIVAIGAFNAYAQYAAVENYNLMVEAYNTKLEEYCPDLTGTDYVAVYKTENGEDIVEVKGNGADDFIYFTVKAPADWASLEGTAQTEYLVNADKTYYVNTSVVKANENHAEGLKAFTEKTNEDGTLSYTEDKACQLYVVSLAQDAVVEAYEKEGGIGDRTKFIWIKNIWMTDASYKHPVSAYTDFQSGIKQEKFDVDGKEVDVTALNTNVYSESAYTVITEKLTKQKTEANGYFIMILLSVGTILLQQFVTMRSQKEQSQFSTVDGQGTQQQKTMMITMTVMFAIFSFMYSAAFSIYMVMSNLISLGSTLIINKIVDKVIEKKEEKAMQEKYNQRFPGRVYKGGTDNSDKKNK